MLDTIYCYLSHKESGKSQQLIREKTMNRHQQWDDSKVELSDEDSTAAMIT